MKNFQKAAVLVLAILMFAVTLPTATAYAADDDMRYGRTKLNADSRFIYDKLASDCEAAKSEIKMDVSGKKIDFNEDLSHIFNMFYSDYPEYFWVEGSWSADITKKGSKQTLTIKPTYSMSGKTLDTAKSTYNAKVKELTKDLRGKSDYEKSKILHDRLINITTYASTNNDQNAYGALVEGKAVCNGYTRAYQHLMESVDVPAWFVRGKSLNPTTGKPIGHAWNMVKLDGKWYYTDVTWDDQDKNTFYEYLNITTAETELDHTLDPEYKKIVPVANSTDANYYKKEGHELAKYDQSKLVNLLKQDHNKTQLHIIGDVYSFLDSVNNDLLAIGKQLGGKGAFQISYSASILKHAIILNVALVSESHTHKAKNTVPQVNASCLSNGTKEYYLCDCELKFSDKACTKQVLSDSELVIPALAHKPSAWKNDASSHWKICTNCGSETANTRDHHLNKNKDNKCDTCAYLLPVADKNGNIALGSGTNSNKNNNTALETSSSALNQDKTPTTSVENLFTDTESDGEATTQSSEPTTQSDDVEQNESTEETKPDNAAVMWIVICGGAALLIAGGGTALGVLLKKK